jgi:VWFA-related protein
MLKSKLPEIFTITLFLFACATFVFAQPEGEANTQARTEQNGKVRTMTIPITIFTKQELRERQADEYLQAGDITVKEDNDLQTILSIRSVSNTPLSLAILIQDDLSSNFNLELRKLGEFIRRLPRNSRVMVAYLRNSLQIRQKFTDDLEKAAGSLRVVTGSVAGTSGNPYDNVLDALKRFDALPSGRRSILLISDGLDISRGVQSSSPNQSIELERAILEAQRKSVAIYSIYSPTQLTENSSSILNLNGQGSLSRISDETGGRAFFQGTGAPVSFDPFFKDLSLSLSRQFALTYLSTHMKKGYHKVQVTSTNPEVRIEHPRGYYYR